MQEESSLRGRLARLFELDAGPGRIASMEGYRGLAILLVLFVHFDTLFGDYLAAGSALRSFSGAVGRLGNAGVDLFFVASGYLIYGAVVRKRVDYGRFMVRRVERIFPTFLAVFAVYVALSLLAPSRSKIPSSLGDAALYLLANALLLPGMIDFDREPMITVAWSLSYEFFYYLGIPLLVAATGMRSWTSRARVAFFAALSVAWFVFCLVAYDGRVRLGVFLAGILLHEAMHGGALVARLSAASETTALALFAAAFPLMHAIRERVAWLSFLPGIETHSGVWQVVVMFAAFFGFALHCFAYDGLTRRLFEWTPLRWLGNISYSYYLIHGLTLVALSELVHRAIPPDGETHLLLLATLFCVGFAATVVTSTALFALVEKPWSLRPKGTGGPGGSRTGGGARVSSRGSGTA